MCAERVKINFGPNGETKDFRNTDELRVYLNSDEFLNWTKEISPKNHNDRMHLGRLVGNFVNELTQITFQGDLPYIASQISVLMQDRPYPTSKSPLAKWLKKLNQREPDRAAYALFALVNAPPSSFDFKCATGAADLAFFRAGFSTETAEAGLEALNDLRQEQHGLLLEMEAAKQAQQRHFDQLIVELNATERASLEERARSHTLALDSFEEKSTSALAALEATRRSYIDYMSLGAPVEYWQDKAKRHLKALEGTGSAWPPSCWGYERRVPVFFGFVIFAAVAYAMLAVKFIYVPQDIERTISIATVGALLTTVLLWYARILTRQLLRHRHLYEDAEERRVMISCYLAMSVEEKVEKEDRVLALGAAFRAASDGVSSDDGAPDISTAAIIGRLVQNGR